MKRRDLLAIFTAAFLLFCSELSIAGVPSQATSCSASELSFSVGDKGGHFKGMSQSGVLLVLHNIGSHACSVPARAILSFENAEHHPLPVSLQIPRGMHPGPVILPAVIPVGAWATSEMHWVSSDVYGGNNCVSPAFIVMSIGEETLRTKFAGDLCGPKGKAPTYTLTFFKLDPTYPRTSQK